MASIETKLTRLGNRRKGFDRIDALAEQAQLELLQKRFVDEVYQKRAPDRPHTRYALGAMQEVDEDYTRISLEEAGRVGNQLESGLTAAGIWVGFRLQGSVPLNVHIRGVSDVDLLALDRSILTTDPHGVKSKAGNHYVNLGGTTVADLQKLRRQSEAVLESRFPKATVDKSGGKAIKISGGSLRRPVDVVPSHWHDTADYQMWGLEHDRAVRILAGRGGDTLLNLPFLHIKRVGDRDGSALGGLKKAIRLCKNVKADAIEDGTEIKLPSFDVAALVYHANVPALIAGVGNELAILAETQRHLDALARNIGAASSLRVPDGSRTILDTAEKQNGLVKLSVEMDELAQRVAVEQHSQLMFRQQLTPDLILETLKKSHVPA